MEAPAFVAYAAGVSLCMCAMMLIYCYSSASHVDDEEASNRTKSTTTRWRDKEILFD